MRALRWIHGVSLKEHIDSEDTRKRATVKPFVARVTKW